MAAGRYLEPDWLWVPPALDRDAVELLAFVVSLGAFVLPWVALLVASYPRRYWWFESVDLLRKFALASLVVALEEEGCVALARS